MFFSLNGTVLACSAKASSILGRFKWATLRFDANLAKNLYKVYVRSLIEFDVPVWKPCLKVYINHLEGIQHRVTRMVQKLRKLSYYLRLKQMGLTLEDRRVRGDLIQLF